MGGQSKYKKSPITGRTNKVTYKWMNDQSLLRVDSLNKSRLLVDRRPKSPMVGRSKQKSPTGGRSKQKLPTSGRTIKVAYRWTV